MNVTTEQAFQVMKSSVFNDLFENITLLKGAPIPYEGEQGRFFGIVSPGEECIDVEITGPYDDTVLTKLDQETDPLHEGVNINIEGSQHILALFSRCAKRRGKAMIISLSFDIDPFA